MRHVRLPLLALLVFLFAAQDVAAQDRGRDRDQDRDRTERREDRDRRERDDERENDDAWGEDEWENDDEARRRGERRRQGRKGNAPPFCQNGQGHPVHGRAWCIEKGYGLGDGRYERNPRYDNDRYERDRRYGDYYDYDRRRWQRVDARGITLRVGLLDRFREGLDEDALRRTLGRDAFYRLRSHQRRLGLRGRLHGRLGQRGGVLSGNRERTLRVFADGNALARFADLDGDERVDVVLLRRHR